MAAKAKWRRCPHCVLRGLRQCLGCGSAAKCAVLAASPPKTAGSAGRLARLMQLSLARQKRGDFQMLARKLWQARPMLGDSQVELGDSQVELARGIGQKWREAHRWSCELPALVAWMCPWRT